jgi:hypothetical protein
MPSIRQLAARWSLRIATLRGRDVTRVARMSYTGLGLQLVPAKIND